MRILLYDAEGHDSEITLAQLPQAQPSETRLLWLNATLEELLAADLPSALAEAVRGLDTEDPRVHLQNSHYTFALSGFLGGSEHQLGRTAMIVGDNWIITAGVDTSPDFDAFVEQDTGETLKGKLTASSLGAALLSEHLGDLRARLSTIDNEIDRLEDAILRNVGKRNVLPVLAVLRRRVARLRKIVAGHRPVMQALIRPDFHPQIPEDDRVHFQHLADTFARLEDEVARARETVIGSFELYATRVAQDTNRLLKALTLITVITGMTAAIAGLFGMNFKIPFFESGERGFYLVLGGMGLLSVGLVALGLWRRWF